MGFGDSNSLLFSRICVSYCNHLILLLILKTSTRRSTIPSSPLSIPLKNISVFACLIISFRMSSCKQKLTTPPGTYFISFSNLNLASLFMCVGASITFLILSGIELKVLVKFSASLCHTSKSSLSPIFRSKKEVSENVEFNVSILARLISVTIF